MSDPQATDVAWIALGANLGHRGKALARLRDELQRQGLVIEAASAEILTRPAGVLHQPDFHNQVIRVRSPEPLPPTAWLRLAKEAEVAAGRRPTYRWGPRHADADILFLGRRGELTVNLPDLAVPHPRITERPFLVRLLQELGMSAQGNSLPRS